MSNQSAKSNSAARMKEEDDLDCIPEFNSDLSQKSAENSSSTTSTVATAVLAEESKDISDLDSVSFSVTNFETPRA